MKHFMKLAILLGLLLAVPAFAQTGTTTTQSPSHLDGCTSINSNAAVNNQVTLTITPPNGSFVYIGELDFQVANDATGAVTQANVKFTTTNLASWQFQYSSTNAANTSTSFGPWFFGPGGLRSTSAGTAVTIVSPAANTHAAYNINACFWFATS